MLRGGGLYDVLGSFARGLFKGFKEQNIPVFDFVDCVNKKINFNIALAFNLSGEPCWKNVLEAKKINVFYSIDSIFAQNYAIPLEYKKYDNFITFCVTSADSEAVKFFMPELKFAYLPHATDCDLWVNKKEQKENDIVLFASINDFEAKLDSLKNSSIDKKTSNLIFCAIDIAQKHPNLTFFEIYNLIKSDSNIELDLNSYIFLYNFVTFIAEQKQKIKMVESLSDFNLKIYGNDLWKKYIKGKAQYKGIAQIKDTIDIVNKSKISLHCHPIQLNGGLHERFLNSACAGTFCLTSDTPSIKEEFKDNFGYFNHANFEDIKDKANYFLTHEQEREQKALQARQIVLQKHLWRNRASQIDKMFY